MGVNTKGIKGFFQKDIPIQNLHKALVEIQNQGGWSRSIQSFYLLLENEMDLQTKIFERKIYMVFVDSIDGLLIKLGRPDTRSRLQLFEGYRPYFRYKDDEVRVAKGVMSLLETPHHKIFITIEFIVYL